MYEHFTSLTPEEEREFLVYEQRTREAAKKANIIGWASAGAFLLFIFIAILVTPKPHSSAPAGLRPEDVKEEAAPAKAPAAAPTPAPTEAAPAAPTTP